MNPLIQPTTGQNLYLALTLKRRLLLFCLTAVICFFIISVISVMVQWRTGMATSAAVRIVTIMQDVILFIMPPVITAVLVTRQPATLLAIDRLPNLGITLMLIIALCVSIPAMNLVIYLNENAPLPEALRAMEDNAAGAVELLTGKHDIPNLIMTILIVGVLAGVSEELLFRGGLQRLLVTGGMNAHCAIWLTAAIFSLMHMQFFGFVPRMLLGAFFGYALWWSRSLWLPVLLHTLNNTSYVISQYLAEGSENKSPIDDIGIDSPALICLSAVLTAAALYYARKLSTNH